jgi:hypothetical protein
MMLHTATFDQLDKNKWNGSVYYATNGNPFGFYWYLKCICREWSALIEGDYESVMPVPGRQFEDWEWALLPWLGPYSVNALSPARIQAFIEAWRSSGLAQHGYRFNPALTHFLTNHVSPGMKLHEIKEMSVAETLGSNASEGQFSGIRWQEYTIQSVIKPELLLEEERMPSDKKNAMYRIAYQGLQRSCWEGIVMTHSNTGHKAYLCCLSFQNTRYILHLGNNNHPLTERCLLAFVATKNQENNGRLLFYPGVKPHADVPLLEVTGYFSTKE